MVATGAGFIVMYSLMAIGYGHVGIPGIPVSVGDDDVLFSPMGSSDEQM
jgi:hypothetical protein